MTMMVNPAQAPFLMTNTQSTGSWMHAPGSTFVFAYLYDNWSQQVKQDMAAAFSDALAMSETIKNAVKDTSGQDVVDGLYLLDQEAMTKAMNSIPGMGMTGAKQGGASGRGTATKINGEFFATVLAGLGGDVAPILEYLNDSMAKVQAQTRQSTVKKDFGTVMGMVSLMPILNVPVTTFSYVYSGSETKSFFVSTICGSHEEYSYDYKYTNAVYNYNKP